MTDQPNVGASSAAPINLQHVADQVRTGAKRLEWMLRLAEALEQLGSLDQAERELRARLGTVQRSLTEAESKLSETERGILDARKKAEREASRLEEETSERIATEATRAAQQAEQATAAHATLMHSFQDEEQRAEKAASDAKGRLTALQEQIAQAEGRLEDVRKTTNATLAAARDRLANV